jgi:hypothetical protein
MSNATAATTVSSVAFTAFGSPSASQQGFLQTDLLKHFLRVRSNLN